MKKLARIMPAVVASVALAGATSAATIQFTSTLPTANVLASNTATTTANIQVRNIGTGATADRWVGFGFKAPAAASLDQVTFYIDPVNPPTASGNSGSLGASMTISIYALDSLTASPAANASPLYTETATVPAAYNNESYITFDLAAPYALTSGGYYGVMISFDTLAASRGMNLLQAASTVGGTGNIGYTFFTYDSGATYTSNNHTLNFVVQSVPEASSASFLLLAGVTAIALGARHRSSSTL